MHPSSSDRPGVSATQLTHVAVPSNVDLGRAIRRLRRARRMTIEGLAHDADMHPTYLSGIERGVRNPTWSKLADLARGLEVSLAEIVQDAEAEAKLALRMRAARAELGLSERFA
jgi:transcriptional regulator with XRE-family HTH domain